MKPIVNLILFPDFSSYPILSKIFSSANICFKIYPLIFVRQDIKKYSELFKNYLNEGLISDFDLVILSSSEDSYKQINNLFLNLNSPTSQFILFLSPHVLPDIYTFPILLNALINDTSLAGVNPLFVTCTHNQHPTIAHMGTVIDCQKKLHFLYEGINTDNLLSKKRRIFQLAHPSCLLIRLKDFIQVGGFKLNIYPLTFYSLCFSIISLGKKGFSTIPDAKAILEDRFESWNFCGVWNSILQRGRLDTRNIKVDYPLICHADGLEYKIDDWLNEFAALPDESLSTDPEFQWRHHPQPKTLLHYITTLPEQEKKKAIDLARSLPVSLPRVFQYYPVQKEKILQWAKSNGDLSLEKECHDWNKRKRSFHYSKLKAGIKLLKETGFYNYSLEESPAVFDAWVELAESFSKIGTVTGLPDIAVLMPVWNPEPRYLIEAIESVLNQDYPSWQLCIADDASTNPEIREILKTYFSRDPRIRVKFRGTNGHICQASNSALELVTAPFTAFMDHDDLLSPYALGENARLFTEKPSLSFIYSDDDRIDENNVRRSPVFKPDFSGDIFFTGHLSTYSTDLLRKLGGLRPGTEGSQDQDLRIRASELLKVENIAHIPKILYHWRVHEKSTASTIKAKPYVLEATKKILLDAAQRKGLKAEILENARNNFFRVLYELPENLRVTIVVYSDNPRIKISHKLKSLLAQLSSEFQTEVLITEPSEKWLETCQKAIKKISGDVVAFLHAGLEPGSGCRLDQLLFMGMQAELGLVGGLIWQDERLLNGGFYPDITGYPFPLLQGLHKSLLASSSWGQFLLPRHVLGIARHCMVVRSDILRNEEFLKEEYGELATVDFAIRQMRKGRYCLVSPWGQWEVVSKPGFPEIKPDSLARIREKWGDYISKSGIRNPNLRATRDNMWTLNFS